MVKGPYLFPKMRRGMACSVVFHNVVDVDWAETWGLQEEGIVTMEQPAGGKLARFEAGGDPFLWILWFPQIWGASGSSLFEPQIGGATKSWSQGTRNAGGWALLTSGPAQHKAPRWQVTGSLSIPTSPQSAAARNESRWGFHVLISDGVCSIAEPSWCMENHKLGKNMGNQAPSMPMNILSWTGSRSHIGWRVTRRPGRTWQNAVAFGVCISVVFDSWSSWPSWSQGNHSQHEAAFRGRNECEGALWPQRLPRTLVAGRFVGWPAMLLTARKPWRPVWPSSCSTLGWRSKSRAGQTSRGTVQAPLWCFG